MSLTRFEDNREIEEETPFLQDVQRDFPPTPTPLPIAQISILLTTWLADSIVSNSISPYLNQLVRELPNVGGDARKVGYYTGIIMSLHYAAEAATSFQWNRLSDYVGRKLVLLICVAGTTVSILLFGLSHSFLALVLSRCLHGAMRGHHGVVKIMIADLTDETNVARGFSMKPVAWSLGHVIGPFIGGIFSRPQDRWPNVFSHPFWGDNPYFLPCLLTTAFTCLSFVITSLYLEETMSLSPSPKPQLASANSEIPLEVGDDPVLDMSPNESDKPLPLRSVLTRPVLVSVAVNAVFALLNVVAISYIPLVWSTPVEFGGLNLSPASIGLWLSIYGGVGGIFQYTLFSYVIGRFGLRRVFVSGIVACAMIFAIFPFENLALRMTAGAGPSLAVWLFIILQLSSLSVFDLGYGTINIYISAAAPNKRSLGAAMGLSQVAASIQSAVGPAAADWLFAFSLTHNILGGYFAYIVLIGAVCAGLCMAMQLPKNGWTHRNR